MSDASDVLVVDDNEFTREAVAAMLETRGMRVLRAANGREALDALARPDPPRVVVLDLMMPEMDGPTFLGQLALMRGFDDVAVVVLTAMERPKHHPRARLTLSKPVAGDTLLAAVESCRAR